jgi:hypothetical protein
MTMISSHEDGWDSGDLSLEEQAADGDYYLDPLDRDDYRQVYEEVRERGSQAYYDGCVLARCGFPDFCDFLTGASPEAALLSGPDSEWVRRHRSVLETMHVALPRSWGVDFLRFAQFARRRSGPCSIFC